MTASSPHNEAQEPESGKWNFTDDGERRLAIEAEAEQRRQMVEAELDSRNAWIKHLIWATALTVTSLGWYFFRTNGMPSL